ncbi:hypothetical protein B0H63DRAFT_523082 [Podospora didyma]|uniref:Uncharacterized protein n=1 Tax=Podospora didyma TaxID=330526 RepID=A0AAE0U057_9PEZI|nr:hypothetical protein B0H63DRAFT_523082 [Podospora didyma]
MDRRLVRLSRYRTPALLDIVHTTAKAYLIQQKHVNIAQEHAGTALFSATYLSSKPFLIGTLPTQLEKTTSTGFYSHHELDADLWEKTLKAVRKTLVDIRELDHSQDEAISNDAVSLFQHVSKDMRDWQNVDMIELHVKLIRDAIETVMSTPQGDGRVPKIPLSGGLRYKCPKFWCQFFCVG